MRGGGDWFPILVLMVLFLLAVKAWPHAKRRFQHFRHRNDIQMQEDTKEDWQSYRQCDN